MLRVQTVKLDGLVFNSVLPERTRREEWTDQQSVD